MSDKKKAPSLPIMDEDALRHHLKNAHDAKLRDCHGEIAAVLQKHGCNLSVNLSITQDGRVTGIPVVVISKGK